MVHSERKGEKGEMSSFYVDFKSRKPIYEQLVENVSSLVLRGILKPNESIPSVRQLAQELGINPNTIHKAYAELERRGIIYSTPGRGSFVSDDIVSAHDAKKSEIRRALSAAAKEAHDFGIEYEEAEEIIRKEWFVNDRHK